MSVPLPQSPGAAERPRDSFDALLELLDTDGPNGGLSRLSATTAPLRDDDGRFDMARIRAALDQDSDIGPSFDLGVEPPAFESTAQFGTPRIRAREQSHANEPSSLFHTEASGFTPESAQSVSPLALPAGLAGASSIVRDEPVPFDSLLDTPVPVDFQLLAKQTVMPHPPPLPGPAPRENPELKKLSDELTKAKEEVRDLKSRLKITKSLLVRNNEAQHVNIPPGPVSSGPTRYHTLDPMPASQRDEVDALDGDAARAALRNLLASLSLPLSTVSTLASSPPARSAPSVSIHANPVSVEEVQGALQLVRDVDELVWRRQRFPGAVAPLDVFHENNIIDLRDRLELWERAVRAPPL